MGLDKSCDWYFFSQDWNHMYKHNSVIFTERCWVYFKQLIHQKNLQTLLSAFVWFLFKTTSLYLK